MVLGMITLVIATRNMHKVSEIRAVLSKQFECLSLDDFPGAPEVIEDAATFAGNSTKKAVALARWISGRQSTAGGLESTPEMFVLADDSGLEVDALVGAPGVHSARFAALDTGQPGNSTSADNNAKLLRLLSAVPRELRTARFKCVLALTPVLRPALATASPVCSADELEFTTRLFEGVCEGRIGFELRGAGGFGYDPLFFPDGYDQTFGELSESEKNTLSHRARALAGLEQAFKHAGPSTKSGR